VLSYIGDKIERDFYIELCIYERWSVLQLNDRINSLLFERTAISRKPEETIADDLAKLRIIEHEQIECGYDYFGNWQDGDDN